MIRSRDLKNVKKHVREEGALQSVKRAPTFATNRAVEAGKYVVWPLLYGSDRKAVYRILDDRGEIPVYKGLLSEISDGDVFFDIGANTGQYSGLVASTISEGKVISFEPNTEYCKDFERKMRDLNLKSDIVLKKVALSDTNGQVSYSQDLQGIGIENDDTVSVEQRRGDDLIENGEIPLPDVLKIDVDGSEIRVLNGLKKTLENTTCTLYIEVHTPISGWKHDIENHDGSISELTNILDELCDDVRIIHSRWYNYFVKAEIRK